VIQTVTLNAQRGALLFTDGSDDLKQQENGRKSELLLLLLLQLHIQITAFFFYCVLLN